MTDAPEATAATPATDEHLRLLGLLARAGAAVRRDASDPAAAGVEVAAPDGPLGWASEPIWQAVVDAGWVAEIAHGVWRLSSDGRRHLKRVRSATGAPASRPAGAGAAALPPTDVLLPRLDMSESPLAWLARRRDKDGRPMISAVQFEAGERLRADFWFAEMTPRVTSNWSAVPSGSGCTGGGAGPGVRDTVLAARERVRLALAAVGPELSGILIDVCAHLKGLEAVERHQRWPQRSAKIVLQFALDGLARHYGMLRGGQCSGRPRARHWGAAGYRPMIDR